MYREEQEDATVCAQGVRAVVDGQRQEVYRAVKRQRGVLEPHQLVLNAPHALPVVTPADVLRVTQRHTVYTSVTAAARSHNSSGNVSRR